MVVSLSVQVVERSRATFAGYFDFKFAVARGI
jgi:hypothetical protein